MFSHIGLFVHKQPAQGYKGNPPPLIAAPSYAQDLSLHPTIVSSLQKH